MPQVRKYEDQAQRQAAYRQRKGRKHATQAELASLARNLHYVIQTAIAYNDLPIPHELAAARPEHTLTNLIRLFNVVYDPVRNPNGRQKRPPINEQGEEQKTT